ncbi:MAG: hypothetical protein FJX34_04160 [Alphaproteobacteria bacterium]|nr:hypothetical protein [Alphaproteobacteria bacterium]
MTPRFFFHLYSHKIFFWLFVATFGCQIFFWKETEKVRADFDIIPPAPNKYVVSAASLGDKEFLFRVLVTRLQNSGDIFAGFVALKDYDYSRIYDWMKSLDTLNPRSRLVPSLASYYYSQTQNPADATKIIDYLEEHSVANLDANWWWLFQALYIAKRLGDFDRALDLAQKMAQNNAKDAPLWTKQMPAFIAEEKGDGCVAFSVIQKLIAESDSGKRQISAEEMDFMRYFISNRLKHLKNNKFDPRRCSKTL